MRNHHAFGRSAALGLMFACGLAAPTALAQDAPIKAALESVSEDVIVFNDHLSFLAHPYLGGRLPGTPGMEMAKDYIETQFRNVGLQPAFAVERDGRVIERASYRQPFPLGGTTEVTRSEFSAAANGREMTMTAGEDYQVTGIGGSGDVTAPVTFVGYGIDSAANDYTAFGEDDSLEGKVAMVLRFEPMDEDGNSLWADSGWSNAASFNSKIRSVAERNPEAIILVNTPGANDPRISTLLGATDSGGRVAGVPVIHMTPDAAEAMVAAGDNDGRTLMDLRRLADEAGTVVDLDLEVSIDAVIERRPLMAENVGGLIPGKGDLADEVIVIGAHADHLGMGAFGSRASADERGTTLHPGADDNASGTAGIIMIGQWLSEQYAQLPDDADARTILICAFSGEESGLNGSRYYVNEPIVPLDDHYLMLNFDMIGRIENKRLSVSGTTSAEGFNEWLEPIFADSGLEIVKPQGAGGGSDHLPFMQRQIPILFAIIADFHGDYHTPADVLEKINRVDAVKASRLFSDIAFEAAQRRESLVFAMGNSGQRRGGGNRGAAGGGDAAAGNASGGGSGPGGISVRIGVMPGNYDGEGGGVLLSDVTDGGPAEKAGLRGGDRLVRWDGQKIPDIQAWMGMLGKHEPGDEVNVGVMRDGEEVTIKVKLEGRDG